jgi:uncharacterized SAM-binding protein YcdF (DUF218 family)
MFANWKRYRRILVFFLGGVCLLAVVLYRPLLRALGQFLVVSDSLEKADAIILLGEEVPNSPRLRKAVELYRAGWAPRIVASGRYLRPYLSEAELLHRDLVEAGVPEARILTLAHSPHDRFEESAALRRLIQAQHWKRVLFVSALQHSRRIHSIFQRDLGDLVDLRVVAAPDNVFRPDSWWHSRRSARMVVQEYLHLMQFWISRPRLEPENTTGRWFPSRVFFDSRRTPLSVFESAQNCGKQRSCTSEQPANRARLTLWQGKRKREVRIHVPELSRWVSSGHPKGERKGVSA